MGVGLLIGIWLARYLGPKQYGSFNYIFSYVGIFSSIAELGLASIVVKELVVGVSNAKRILGSAAILQLVGASIAVSLIYFSVLFFENDKTLIGPLIVCFSFSLFFKATDVIRYWFESRVESRYIVWMENSVFLSMALVRLLLIVNKANMATFIFLSLFEAFTIATALVTLYYIKVGSLLSWKPRFNYAKSLFSQSWPLLLASLSVTIYSRIDIVMLQGMMGEREVGIYSAATKISELIYFLPVILMSSISPALINLHKKNKALFDIRISQLYFFLAWIAICFSLIFSLLSADIVKLIFGEAYADAAPVLTIHVWASVAVFLGVASSQYLLINNLQKISFYRTLIGLLINIILNLITIPLMGAVGAALSTLISYFLATYSLIFFKETRLQLISLIISPFNLKIFRK